MAVNRKGKVFIGGYFPPEIKEFLTRRAAAEHRTASNELGRILRREMEREKQEKKKAK